MTYIQRYAADMEEFKLRAIGAAWETTPCARIRSLTAIFSDCRTAAQIYADPQKVRKLFVCAVSEVFRTELTAHTRTSA